MVDRPPAQRYRIIERGGRLEVLDSETGGRPQSAAERMAIHDAAHGHAALRYDRIADNADGDAARAAPALPAAPVPARAAVRDPIRAALEKRTAPAPNSNGGRLRLGAQSSAEAQARPQPKGGQSSSRPAPRSRKKPIVTQAWWDTKAPRTLDLGETGRQRLSTGIATTLIVSVAIAIVLTVIQPVLLLIAGFLLFRFGRSIIAPIGTRLVDEAIRADDGGR